MTHRMDIARMWPSLDTSPAWLEPGRKIHVRSAATWYGPMSMEVESTPNALHVSIEPPTRNPPREIRVHNRRPGDVKSITMNNQPATSYDVAKATLRLPEKSDSAKIVFEY